MKYLNIYIVGRYGKGQKKIFVGKNDDGGAGWSYFMLKKFRLSEISGGLGNFGETLLFFRRF